MKTLETQVMPHVTHKEGKRFLGLLAATTFIVASAAVGGPQAHGQTEQPMATAERIAYRDWWPTSSKPRREEYLGPEACAACHSPEAAIQQTTPMAKADSLPGNSKVLAAHQRLSLNLHPYVYDITRAGGQIVFSVRDGTHSDSAVLGWAFGAGEVAETYVYERAGTFYEGRLSYFAPLSALATTPGQPPSTPADFDRALGRPMGAEEVHLCFGCHSTASATGGQFDPDHLIFGVTCEACHGPGAKHTSAMKQGRMAEGLATVLNPAKLNPVDSVDFCGACHRAWADVMETGQQGLATLRFQPYRLELSRCWGKGDSRITCLACHDPHQSLARDAAAYDNSCLRCHLAAKGSVGVAGHPGAACPRGTKDCVVCHLPKYEVPGTHAKFTDHRIRIVRSEP